MKPPRPAWRTLAVAAGVAIIAASFAVSPPKAAQTKTETLSVGGGTTTTAPTPGAPIMPGQIEPGAPVALPPANPALQCAAGRNGGSTDTGVTGSSIKLGATVVDSGIGASFLRDARYGMLAVANKVNRSGGICGRKLKLELVDDGWEYARGGEFLRNLVEDKKVFALSVVPSSEGLKNISDARYLQKKRVPVVGSDGMLIHQYLDPWIWPVAASTISTMHIMVKQAYDAGARHFGIAYEEKYHFGLEGAYAYNAAVRELTGHDIPGYSDPTRNAKCDARFCGINPDTGSYASEIQTFNSACRSEPRCDFVALLLEPATALKWMNGGALKPSDGVRMGGPQPLFTRSFAEACRAACDKLWLWTGFDPPIGGNLGKPQIAEYVRDLNVTSSSADPANTFAEGAYVGMSMMVQALQRVGPELTRERLRVALDSMTFDSGLAPSLSWSPGHHFANTTMKAFSISFKDRFAGWIDQRVSLADPWVGKHIPR